MTSPPRVADTFDDDAETSPGREWVAIILASAVGLAVVMITFASLWDALFHSDPGLSENATQLLGNAFTGILSVLSGFLGFKFGDRRRRRTRDDVTPPE